MMVEDRKKSKASVVETFSIFYTENIVAAETQSHVLILC